MLNTALGYIHFRRNTMLNDKESISQRNRDFTKIITRFVQFKKKELVEVWFFELILVDLNEV